MYNVLTYSYVIKESKTVFTLALFPLIQCKSKLLITYNKYISTDLFTNQFLFLFQVFRKDSSNLFHEYNQHPVQPILKHK